NILGRSGATLADLLFQSFGLAAALLPLILLYWSVRLLLGRGLDWLWLRLALLLPMVLLFALALAVVPAPRLWPAVAGLGGFTGKLLSAALVHQGVPAPLAALASVALAALLLLFVTGLSIDDWRNVVPVERASRARRRVTPRRNG